MTEGKKVNTDKTLKAVNNKGAVKLTTEDKNLEKYINDLIVQSSEAIAKALPKHLSSERMGRVLQTAVKRNPELMKCTSSSLLSSMLLSAQLGLEPDTLGHCYLIPRRNGKTGQMDCQFQLGYQGILDLARRSGEIESIDADVICEGEHFEYVKGLETKFEHIPSYEIDRDDPDKIKAFYAVAKFKDGGHHILIIGKKRVDSIKDKYAQGTNSSYSPWNKEYAQMGKKTVIKQAYKYWPRSIEMKDFIEQDFAVKRDIVPNMTAYQKDEDQYIKEDLNSIETQVIKDEDEDQIEFPEMSS